MTSEKIMNVFDVIVGYLNSEESVVIPKAKLHEDVGDLTIAEIDAIVNTLQLNEFIRLKYVDQDVYCIGIQPAGIREKERREEIRREEERRRAAEEEKKRQEEEKKRLEEERARTVEENLTEGQDEEENPSQPEQEDDFSTPMIVQTKEESEEYFKFSKKGVVRFMVVLGMVVAVAIILSIVAVSIAVGVRG